VSAHQPSRLSRVELDRGSRGRSLLPRPVGGCAGTRELDRAMRDVDDGHGLSASSSKTTHQTCIERMLAPKERQLRDYAAASPTPAESRRGPRSASGRRVQTFKCAPPIISLEPRARPALLLKVSRPQSIRRTVLPQRYSGRFAAVVAMGAARLGLMIARPPTTRKACAQAASEH
jgi:hypothetical protein